MGWTSYKTKQSFMDIFKAEYAFTGDHRFLKSIEVRIANKNNFRFEDVIAESEIFSAVQYKDSVYAHVFKVCRDSQNEVYFRGEDETVGPYTINKCPKEIMDMLTPVETLQITPGYAEKWRKRQK